MDRYIAFDVETPNRYNNRMSAIGISVVEDGRIIDSFFSLVDPEQPFDWFNTQLTGIDSRAVRSAPTFPALWERIEPIMSSGVLVAHNAPFDLGVLKNACRSTASSGDPGCRGSARCAWGGGSCRRSAIGSMTCAPITGSIWIIIGLTATAWPAPGS